MIVICERCGSEYEVGDIEEGKILRCNKCGDTWKHLLNKKKNIINESKLQDELNEHLQVSDDSVENENDISSDVAEDESEENEEKKSGDFWFYVLFIILMAMIYFMFQDEIATFVERGFKQ